MHVHAQTPLGLKGGIQTTALTREGSTRAGEAFGYMFGMFFHPVNKHPVTGEFEILFTRKGDPDFRALYLQVPVLLNIKIADRFFFGGGGYAAFNMGSTSNVTKNGITVFGDFNFLDVGYILELGYWKDRIESGIRFEKALTNSFSFENLNFKNRAWVFYVGYHL